MKTFFCTLFFFTSFFAMKATAQIVPFSYMRIQEITSNLRAVTTLSGRDITANRPSAGCSAGNVVPMVFQAIRVSKTGMYSILSTQSSDGYLIVLRDYADVSNLLTSCVMANDDYTGPGNSYLVMMLEANRDYFIVSANYSINSSITYNTKLVGPGLVTETSATLNNTAASLSGVHSGDYVYLKGLAKSDATAISIYNDQYCVNKVNSGPEDLATFNTTGLKTLLGPDYNIFYGRVTDPIGMQVCTPLGRICAISTPPAPGHLTPMGSTTSNFINSPSFNWDALSSCSSSYFEYAIGTTSGGTDWTSGWKNFGATPGGTFSDIFPAGSYYLSLRVKATDGTTSPVTTADWTVALSANAASFSSNLIAGDPTFLRPSEGTPPTAGGFATRYQVRSFTVGTSGTYKIGSKFTGFDGFLVLYKDSFNPSQPTLNAVTAVDDYAGLPSASLISFSLTAGTTYYIVNTAYSSNAGGPFVTILDGLGVVTLNP